MRQPKKHARSAVATLAVSLFFAFLLLALAEGVLRASGYGHATRQFVADTLAVPGVWRDNPGFARRFFPGPWMPDAAPTQMAIDPPANTLRIAVLGESAAYGYPDPAFGFARMLEAQLAYQYPERKVEVINAALSGVDSTVLRESLRDLLPMRPDVVILYIGNNEFIGPFGAGTPGRTGLPSTWWSRAQVLATRLRLSQWLRHGPQQGRDPDQTPMASQPLYTNDARVAATEARYRDNLRAMLALAAARGVPVVLCTVAVNTQAWAPFDTSAATVQAFDAATALLPESCDAARAGFANALRDDALRYRTTPAMNAAVRELAAASDPAQVRLADCDKALEPDCVRRAASPDFYDHCHPTPQGNFAIAGTVGDALAAFLPPPAAAALDYPALLQHLGWTPWHAQANLRYVLHQAAKPPYPGRAGYEAWRQALEDDVAALAPETAPEALRSLYPMLEAACAADPDDVFLARNRVQVQAAAGDIEAAASLCRTLTQQFPRYAQGWSLLGETERSAGDLDNAANAWGRACSLRPDREDWARQFADALHAAGRHAEARTVWQDLCNANPGDPLLWWRMAQTFEAESNWAAAVGVYRNAIVQLPANASLRYYLAKALLAQGDLQAAAVAAAEGLRLAPDNAGLQQLAASLKN